VLVYREIISGIYDGLVVVEFFVYLLQIPMSPEEEAQARAQAGQLANRDQANAQMEQRKMEQEAREEQRRTIVRSVLDGDALERLNRIGLVKPDKQRRLEEVIFANVQRGVIKQKIDEGTFVDLLKQIESAPTTASGAPATGSVQFKRRAFDDDDDIDLDNLE
jgi:programmed cell death protein 5